MNLSCCVWWSSEKSGRGKYCGQSFSQHAEDAPPCLAQGWCSQQPLIQASALNSEEQSSKYSSAFYLCFITWFQVGKSSTSPTSSLICTSYHQYSISLQPRGNWAETRLRLDAAQTPSLCYNLIQAISLLWIKAQIRPYKLGMKHLTKPHLNKYVTCDHKHFKLLLWKCN